MYRRVLNGMVVPRAASLITHVKGSGRRLGTGARKRANERNFLVSSLCAVTAMINTESR